MEIIDATDKEKRDLVAVIKVKDKPAFYAHIDTDAVKISGFLAIRGSFSNTKVTYINRDAIEFITFSNTEHKGAYDFFREDN